MYNEIDNEGRQFSCLVIIRKQNKFLLLLRPNSPNVKFPNMWSFPGGGSIKGEEPLQTAIRETHEETGLRVYPENLKLLFQTTDAEQQKNVYFFVCEKWSEKIDNNKIKSEHVKYAWIKHSDLYKYKMPPNNLNLMKRLISRSIIPKNIKLVIER